MKIDLSLIPIEDIIKELDTRFKDSGYIFGYFDPTNIPREQSINTYWADGHFCDNISLCSILQHDILNENKEDG